MEILLNYYIYSTFFFITFFGLMFIFYKKDIILNFLDIAGVKDKEIREYISKTDFTTISFFFKNLIILFIPFFRILYLITYISLTFFPKVFEKAYLSSPKNKKILEEKKKKYGYDNRRN